MSARTEHLEECYKNTHMAGQLVSELWGESVGGVHPVRKKSVRELLETLRAAAAACAELESEDHVAVLNDGAVVVCMKTGEGDTE